LKGGDRLQEELAEVLAPYKGARGALIPVLQKVQEKLGYLPEEAVSEIAKFLRVSESDVFGVASFYAQFRFTRPGEHNVRVCLGTACHVRGGARIMETTQKELGIQPGGTTADYKFSLERVACFGSCALAPVMVVDKRVYGRMVPAKAKEILAKYYTWRRR
jgi:NADH-quinone oxidoreductase subunit E